MPQTKKGQVIEKWSRLKARKERIQAGLCATINKPENDMVCENCGGSGEIGRMEQVYDGEPHMADIGTQPCPDCRSDREILED